MIQSRHRPESVYTVSNLTQLLSVWDKIANALTMGLLLIAAVTLLVSGIGIMNIMLATVSSRIREIGIRKAIGATNREIRFQFLAEAVLISLVGGYCRNRDRARDSVFGALPDRVSHSDLGVVGDYRDRGVVAGGRGVRDVAGNARGTTGSGGEFAPRIDG